MYLSYPGGPLSGDRCGASGEQGDVVLRGRVLRGEQHPTVPNEHPYHTDTHPGAELVCRIP